MTMPKIDQCQILQQMMYIIKDSSQFTALVYINSSGQPKFFHILKQCCCFHVKLICLKHFTSRMWTTCNLL